MATRRTAYDTAARQRAVLAILAARRAAVLREIARLETRMSGASRKRAGAREGAAGIRLEIAALEARKAELERAVDGLAGGLGPPQVVPCRDGASTDGARTSAA